MTPFRARFAGITMTLLFLGVAFNALYLQELKRGERKGPSTAVSVTDFSTPVGEAGGLAVHGDGRQGPDDGARVKAAIVRELNRKGYRKSGAVSLETLPMAVLVYEYDSGLPLTGQPTQSLLKHLLFDSAPAPRGTFADRAELDGGLVLEVQRVLLGLGFFSGALTGRMDSWTQKAVSAYQKHRGLPEDGRLSEATLLDLITYAGKPLRQVSGN